MASLSESIARSLVRAEIKQSGTGRPLILTERGQRASSSSRRLGTLPSPLIKGIVTRRRGRAPLLFPIHDSVHCSRSAGRSRCESQATLLPGPPVKRRDARGEDRG